MDAFIQHPFLSLCMLAFLVAALYQIVQIRRDSV